MKPFRYNRALRLEATIVDAADKDDVTRRNLAQRRHRERQMEQVNPCRHYRRCMIQRTSPHRSNTVRPHAYPKQKRARQMLPRAASHWRDAGEFARAGFGGQSTNQGHARTCN